MGWLKKLNVMLADDQRHLPAHVSLAEFPVSSQQSSFFCASGGVGMWRKEDYEVSVQQTHNSLTHEAIN